MDSLNFESRLKFRTHDNKLASLTLVVVALAFVLFKTTFASNISLNNSQPVEYGQGISQAVACSGGSNINVIPLESFVNSSNGGAFSITGFTVTNVPTSCYGDDLQINAFDDTNNSPLGLYAGTNSDVVIYDINGAFYASTAASALVTVTTTTINSFTVSFNSPANSSANVFKIGIQSYPNQISVGCWITLTCTVGSTGPGGGTIYYVSSGFTEAGSSCNTNCHYLEYAPSSWNPSTLDSTGVDWSSDTTHQAFTTDLTPLASATYAQLGYGFSNTYTKMLVNNPSTGYAADTSQAAYQVSQYAGNDSSAGQWFLPSQYELYFLDTSAAKSTGGFVTGGYYFSSSEYSSNAAYYQFFGNTTQSSNAIAKHKSGAPYLSIRPVRAC